MQVELAVHRPAGFEELSRSEVTCARRRGAGGEQRSALSSCGVAWRRGIGIGGKGWSPVSQAFLRSGLSALSAVSSKSGCAGSQKVPVANRKASALGAGEHVQMRKESSHTMTVVAGLAFLI